MPMPGWRCSLFEETGVISVALALLAAVVVGLVVNYAPGRGRRADPAEGSTPQTVLGATALLAAFVVALVLSGTASSYSAASNAAKQEADAVSSLYESAEYLDMPYRQNIQGAAVCFAKAVAGPEWKTLARGRRSSVPNNWTGTGPMGIRKNLLAMGVEAKGFSLIQSEDAKRGDLRNEMIRQANPTVPTALFWLMIALVAISLGTLAYGIPRAKNTPHLMSLVVVTGLFIATVGVLYNLDRPFSGILALKPTSMRQTISDDAKHYSDAYRSTLPCDDQGAPVTPPK